MLSYNQLPCILNALTANQQAIQTASKALQPETIDMQLALRLLTSAGFEAADKRLL